MVCQTEVVRYKVWQCGTSTWLAILTDTLPVSIFKSHWSIQKKVGENSKTTNTCKKKFTVNKDGHKIVKIRRMTVILLIT
jgi:hypothetical protein